MNGEAEAECFWWRDVEALGRKRITFPVRRDLQLLRKEYSIIYFTHSTLTDTRPPISHRLSVVLLPKILFGIACHSVTSIICVILCVIT